MRTSDNTGKLMLAIRAVQSAKPLADKSGTVKIDGAQTRIEKFAPHDEVWSDLQPILDKNNLCVTQFPDVGPDRSVVMVTRITWTNDDGTEEQWAEGPIPVIPPRQGFRELGASWSYIRRIILMSCFGIVAGGDEPDQQEADKLRHIKPPRDDGQRPHMAPIDSEARAVELLRELDELPAGTPLPTVEALSAQFKDLSLRDDTREKVRLAFAAKRAALGLPEKQQKKKP